MGRIYFSSVIKKNYRNSLESLLHFNENQIKYSRDIVNIIEEYGIPEIVSDLDNLRIKIGNFSEVQCIFAFDGNENYNHLIGLIIYYRITIEDIIILHVAVNWEYTVSGKYGDQMLAMRLISKVREVANRLKGIETISIAYNGDFKKLKTIKIK